MRRVSTTEESLMSANSSQDDGGFAGDGGGVQGRLAACGEDRLGDGTDFPSVNEEVSAGESGFT